MAFNGPDGEAEPGVVTLRHSQPGAEPGEAAARAGVLLFRYGVPAIDLFLPATDVQHARWVLRNFAAADETRRRLYFRDCLTSAVFVTLTADGRLVGTGVPIDLASLGIVPAA